MTNRWTIEEENVLIECIKNNLTTLEIDKKIPNRPRNSIECKAKQLGLVTIKSRPNWNQQENEKLINLINNGIKVKEISKILNRTSAAIELQKGKLGLSRKAERNIIWDTDNIEKLKILAAENKTAEEIAIILGVTETSIHTQSHKSKIPIPGKCKPFTEAELTFIKQNYTKLKPKECAKRLNRPTQSVSVQANKMGLFVAISKHSEEYQYYKLINAEFFNRMRKGAKKRNIKFNITAKYIWELFLKQDGKCAYTGMELYLPTEDIESKNRTASLDRIDSDKDYEKGELQWIHKRINWLKSAFSEEEFFYWIEKIYNYRIKPLKEIKDQENTDYCI